MRLPLLPTLRETSSHIFAKQRMPHAHDDIFSYFGEPISAGAPIAAHSFEDRFCITAPEHRSALRALIAEHAGADTQHGLIEFRPEHWDFERLAQCGQWRRFLQTQRKQGLFIEASCVITDGLGEPTSKQILVARRALPVNRRHELRGPAAGALQFSSSAIRLDRIRLAPHAVSSVIGDRVLLPVVEHESRLASVAFDFRDPLSERLRFVWHVRLARCAPGAIVPACDLPYVGAESKGPFQQTIVEWCRLDELKSPGPSEVDADQTNFAKQLQDASSAFVRQQRSDAALMLVRLYQQAAHAGSRNLAGGMSASELVADFTTFVRSHFADVVGVINTTNPLPMDGVSPEIIVRETADESLPLIIETPRTGQRIGVSAVIQDAVAVGESYAEFLSEWHTQHPEIAATLTGLTLICGVRQCRPYVCHNPLTLWHSPLPVDVVRIAVNPRNSRLAVRGVAHAIIQFDRQSPTDWKLVVTRQRHDESTRLPGGKLEYGETPEVAVRRECFEELALEDSDIASLRPIPMPRDEQRSVVEPERYSNEHVTRLVSPKTGELTCYLLYPFLIELTVAGRAKVLSQLNQPKHFPKVIDSAFWCATGLGYDCEYPRRICESLLTMPQP